MLSTLRSRYFVSGSHRSYRISFRSSSRVAAASTAAAASTTTDDTSSSHSRFGARVPLKPWQKIAVAVGSAAGALLNPARADLVAALGETTGSLAFDRILSRMQSSPEGRRILATRPRVTSESVSDAWDMPEGTFGAAYAKFMGTRNFSPDDRPAVRFMDSEDLAYVATRAREVHDFWHVLFNLSTNVIGESALKIVEFQQTYLPMCFLSVVGGTIRLKEPNRLILLQDYLPWALKAGRAASDLMCIYYEEHFHEDLTEVRKKWGILPAPRLHELKRKHSNSKSTSSS